MSGSCSGAEYTDTSSAKLSRMGDCGGIFKARGLLGRESIGEVMFCGWLIGTKGVGVLMVWEAATASSGSSTRARFSFLVLRAIGLVGYGLFGYGLAMDDERELRRERLVCK